MESKTKLALVIAGNFSGDEENADPCSLLNYLPEDIVDCCQLIEWSARPEPFLHGVTAKWRNVETLGLAGYTGIIVILRSGVMEENGIS